MECWYTQHFTFCLLWKSFDTLEWPLYWKALHYNFRFSFISWVKAFYSNAVALNIQNTGWSSEVFPLSRTWYKDAHFLPIYSFYVQKCLSQPGKAKLVNMSTIELSFSMVQNLLLQNPFISDFYEQIEAIWIWGLLWKYWNSIPQGQIKALHIWFSTCKGETRILNDDNQKKLLFTLERIKISKLRFWQNKNIH